jgi:predicted nucleic acid-binding protein
VGATDPDTRAVCDAGPLIHLQQLAAVDLLGDFSVVLVPDAVWQEVVRHEPEAIRASAVRLSRIAPPAEASRSLQAVARAFALGAGELEAIAVAQQESNGLLLTDDAAARLAAEGLGLRVHGTIGVIVRSIRTARRSAEEVIALLEAVPTRCSLHIRKSLLDETIRQVREARST